MPRTSLLLALALAPVLRAAEPMAGSLVAKPEAFPTLINPNCSHCVDEAKRRAADLRADDRVLCWTRGYSDGGAIPHRFFLHPYRVISDSYGVFVFDADAGYARGFAPSYQFRFHGWRNGVMVMRHADGTLFSCLSGVAFDGPRKGTRLTAVPTLVSDWGVWLERYPNAVAYHMFDKYRPVDLTPGGSEDARRSRGPVDPRLAADRLVLGVWDGGRARAYPLDDLERVGFLHESVDGRDRYVLWDGATRTAAAYRGEAMPPMKYPGPRPNAEGVSPPVKEPTERKPVTLKSDPSRPAAPYVDEQTGSRWDVAGRAVEGPRKGWTLTWLDGTVVKWFAWSAEYPETTIAVLVVRSP